MIPTYLVGFLLGLICSFGQPPFNFVLPSLCSIALFLYIIDRIEKIKSVIIFSFCFGYGYFFYSHHWLIESFNAYGDQLLWLIPFALFLIPAAFAPYFALAGFLIKKFAYQNVLIIALIWMITEYLRSYGYVESPWLLIGYIWSDSLLVSQIVSAVGIWGLSFLTILWAGAIYLMILSFENLKYIPGIAIAFIAFIFCHIYGENHLKSSTTPQDATVRIVQSNIDNNVFSRLNNNYENLTKIMNMTKETKYKKNIDFIIWPEGAHEYNVDQAFLNYIKEVIPYNSYLIFNASRINEDKSQHWNSMYVINHLGKIINYYDKMHLVAFGEYVPLRSYFSIIQKITPGAMDYSKGKFLRSVNVTPPFMPSICYEDAFPEFPNQNFTWIVNITNDGWFGASIGPYQHLSIAKFRAIENGVPMVRAALTGISAIIDSFGQTVKQAPLLSEAVIDSNIPPYITKLTYFRKYYQYTVILMMLVLAVIYRFIEKRVSTIKYDIF